MSTKQEQQLLKLIIKMHLLWHHTQHFRGKKLVGVVNCIAVSARLMSNIFQSQALQSVVQQWYMLPKTQELFKTTHLCCAISWLLVLNQAWSDQCCIPSPARQHSSSCNTVKPKTLLILISPQNYDLKI